MIFLYIKLPTFNLQYKFLIKTVLIFQKKSHFLIEYIELFGLVKILIKFKKC